MRNDEILINQLFAGSYLNEGANIGHEVINLFKDDNGRNYLYITPGGKVDSSHSVKSVIFVRNIEGKTTVEVIAKAEKLYPIDVAPNDVKYADTPISNVFSDNIYHGKSDSSIFFTYRTDKIRLPRKNTRILLTINDEFKPNDDAIRLIRLHSNSKAISNQSGRKYYSAQDDYNAYVELQNLLNNDDYWEEDDTTEKLITDESMRGAGLTFLEIIRKENDELTFSNLLAYYFQYNKAIFRKFVREILGVNDLRLRFDIIRESNNNIDLWIEDDNNVFVIENKIKSAKINNRKETKDLPFTKSYPVDSKNISEPFRISNLYKDKKGNIENLFLYNKENKQIEKITEVKDDTSNNLISETGKVFNLETRYARRTHGRWATGQDKSSPYELIVTTPSKKSIPYDGENTIHHTYIISTD